MDNDRKGEKEMSESNTDIEVLETAPQMEQQEQSVTETEIVVQEAPEETPEETTAEPFDFSQQNDVADLLLSMGVDTYRVPTTPYECMTLGLRFGGFLVMIIFTFTFVKWAIAFFSGRWIK